MVLPMPACEAQTALAWPPDVDPEAGDILPMEGLRPKPPAEEPGMPTGEEESEPGEEEGR